jgi:hypothetical protein
MWQMRRDKDLCGKDEAAVGIAGNRDYTSKGLEA